MFGIKKEYLIFGTVLTGISLLPLTGYWYFQSYIFTGCSQRLDIFFSLACILILCTAVCALGAINAPEELITSMSGFAVIVLSWVGVGGMLGTQNLIAVISCWIHFKDDENYSAKHAVVFILYILFALIYGLVMGATGVRLLFSEQTSPWKLRRRQQELLSILREWQTAHLTNRLSTASWQRFQDLIRVVYNKFGGAYPAVVTTQIIDNYFCDVVFHEYRPIEKEAANNIHCAVCSDPIFEGEKYWRPDRRLALGTVHLECFLRSPHAEKAVNYLNAESATDAYEDFWVRMRRNTGTKLV